MSTLKPIVWMGGSRKGLSEMPVAVKKDFGAARPAKQEDAMTDTRPIEFEDSSGNVFEDIGFDKATAGRLAHKAELVGVLYRLQQERNISQVAFSRLVGIPQPRLSKLYGGKIAGMSTDKLFDAIAKLGGHVTIRVEPHPTPAAAGRVEMELA